MLTKRVDFQKLYDDYGEYNVLYDQLNFTSPSVENALLRTQRVLYEELKRVITLLLNVKSPVTVAEIGFGNGAMLIRLAQDFKNQPVKFVGYELSKPFVAFAQKAAQFKQVAVDFSYKDIEKEDLPQSFDIIYSSEVIEHLEKPQEFIQKISQKINPQGYFIATTPNNNNWIKYPFYGFKKFLAKRNETQLSQQLTQKEKQFKLAETEQHIYKFTHNELKAWLEKYGLGVYNMPRSTTLFGGAFIDAHYLLFALLLVADAILDLIAIPQIGWDIIVFAKKSGGELPGAHQQSQHADSQRSADE